MLCPRQIQFLIKDFIICFYLFFLISVHLWKYQCPSVAQSKNRYDRVNEDRKIRTSVKLFFLIKAFSVFIIFLYLCSSVDNNLKNRHDPVNSVIPLPCPSAPVAVAG